MYVDCDSQKISQVVFNLLDNAMKFTSDGKIVVSTAITGEPTSPFSPSWGKDIPNAATTNRGSEDGVSGNHRDGGGEDGDSHVDGQKKDAVLVTVQDTGVGINSKIKDQLFEKFVTRSNQGTGLGLYLSKKIVEGHGGRIWFEETDDHDNNNNTSTTATEQGWWYWRYAASPWRWQKNRRHIQIQHTRLPVWPITSVIGLPKKNDE